MLDADITCPDLFADELPSGPQQDLQDAQIAALRQVTRLRASKDALAEVHARMVSLGSRLDGLAHMPMDREQAAELLGLMSEAVDETRKAAMREGNFAMVNFHLLRLIEAETSEGQLAEARRLRSAAAADWSRCHQVAQEQGARVEALERRVVDVQRSLWWEVADRWGTHLASGFIGAVVGGAMAALLLTIR